MSLCTRCGVVFVQEVGEKCQICGRIEATDNIIRWEATVLCEDEENNTTENP